MRERTMRTSLFTISLVLVSAAFVSWPHAGSTAGPLARVEPYPTQAATATANLEVRSGFAVPRRDPFGNPPTAVAAATNAATAMPLARAVGTALPPVPGIPLLPANAGAGLPRIALGTDDAAAVVRAVVTGDHGFALVESGSAVRIVSRGDRIGGAVVAVVDASGILLDSGKRLSLTPLASEDRKVRP